MDSSYGDKPVRPLRDGISIANQPFTLLEVTSSHLLEGKAMRTPRGEISMANQPTFHIAWSDVIQPTRGTNL